MPMGQQGPPAALCGPLHMARKEATASRVKQRDPTGVGEAMQDNFSIPAHQVRLDEAVGEGVINRRKVLRLFSGDVSGNERGPYQG